MIDSETEGGTRGGTFPLWIHTLSAGRPVITARVIAYDGDQHKISTGKTDRDGYARLLLPDAGSYTIIIVQGKLNARKTIQFDPAHGDVEIDLPSTPVLGQALDCFFAALTSHDEAYG